MALVARAGRTDLETLLRARKLDRTLTTVLPVPGPLEEHLVARTGVAALDERLNGGLPRGQMSEVVGARSSGRASLLFTMLASATARGEIVALVDTLDMFDAASAAACGIDLGRLLWIRGNQSTVDGQWPLAGTHPHVARGTGHPAPSSESSVSCPSGVLWDRAIDRAIKALNLVLQAGGFGLVALDLAEVPLAVVRRLPFTTWLRLQRVIEGSDTACVLLGAMPIARSAGGVTMTLRRGTGEARERQRTGTEGGRVGNVAARAIDGDHRQGTEPRGVVRQAHHALSSSKGAGQRSAVGDGGTRLSCTPTASRDGKPAARGVHQGDARVRHPGAAASTERSRGVWSGDGRRARLFLGLEVEAHLNRASRPEAAPCRIRIGP